MHNSVSIYSQSKISKQRTIIVAVVLSAHLIFIWMLSYLIVPYHVYSPSKDQLITVRLVSIPKSNQNDLTNGAVQHAAPQQIQETSKKTDVAMTLSTKQSVEQTLLLSQQSEKKITKQTKAEVSEKIQNTQVNSIIHQQITTLNQPESQSIRSLENGQGQSELGRQIADQKEKSTSTDKGRSGEMQGQDTMLNQSIHTLSTQMEPIPVNQVDVLSFGKLRYNDQALQQKSRMVILSIFIDSKGNPVQVSIKQSSGINQLDQMALKAAEKSKFKAHKVNGQAVPVVVDFPIDLQLSQRGRG